MRVPSRRAMAAVRSSVAVRCGAAGGADVFAICFGLGVSRFQEFFFFLRPLKVIARLPACLGALSGGLIAGDDVSFRRRIVSGACLRFTGFLPSCECCSMQWRIGDRKL